MPGQVQLNDLTIFKVSNTPLQPLIYCFDNGYSNKAIMLGLSAGGSVEKYNINM